MTRGVPGLPEVAEVLSGFLLEIGVFQSGIPSTTSERIHRPHAWSYEDRRSVRFGTDSVMTPASREQEIPGGQAAFLACWPTGRLAIRVHVTEKLPKADLKRKEHVPDDLDGIPVDVIKFNPQPQLDRDQRHEPLIGGVQIMNTNASSFGTLGMIVFSRGSLRPLGISNYHVMVRTPPVASDVISQPEKNTAFEVLGAVVRSDKTLDCAVCELGGRAWSLEIFGVRPATGTISARIGMKVLKSRVTTGVTWGTIDGIESSAFTIVQDASSPPGELSDDGDSGSVWLELASNQVVGLHFAGEAPGDPTERAKAKHILPVLNKLEVFVLEDAAIGAAFIGARCQFLAKTRAGARCNIEVVYPSGRISSAKGLGAKVADDRG